MFSRWSVLFRKALPFKHYVRNKSVKSEDVPCSDTRATKKYLGQPTHTSHPHLVGKNEVVPLITSAELRGRREKLVECISKNANRKNVSSNIIVIPSATKQYMSDKIPYVFRQNTDFLYFTGCQEPDTCLVIIGNESGTNSTLFVRNPDSHAELWDGPRTAPSDAVQFFGVDRALPVSELGKFMNSVFKSEEKPFLWYDFDASILPNVDRVIKSSLDQSLSKGWESPKQYTHSVRVIKSPTEIELMSKTCDIASEAIMNCIWMSKPGISEHKLFAQVDYDCRILGANFLAYPPVIAGGERATVIHYINNNQVVNDGEMVLMDAGCEYFGYTSDITRTWPVNGTFTDAQRVLYEIVLNVQQELIQAVKKRLSLDQLLALMYFLLGQRLQEIGLINKSASKEQATQSAYMFCPHHVSHYLGMDVHDTPTISRHIPLEPGMVITIEPGIYLNRDFPVPEEFRGLGIRIEDDILVTEQDPVVLTSMCPKSISDIENISAYVNSRL